MTQVHERPYLAACWVWYYLAFNRAQVFAHAIGGVLQITWVNFTRSVSIYQGLYDQTKLCGVFKFIGIHTGIIARQRVVDAQGMMVMISEEIINNDIGPHAAL